MAFSFGSRQQQMPLVLFCQAQHPLQFRNCGWLTLSVLGIFMVARLLSFVSVIGLTWSTERRRTHLPEPSNFFLRHINEGVPSVSLLVLEVCLSVDEIPLAHERFQSRGVVSDASFPLGIGSVQDNCGVLFLVSMREFELSPRRL